MTKIPRVFTPADNLHLASDFNYNISTNVQEVAERRELRGLHANIVDDQTAGIEVGMRTLRMLDDPDQQADWAQILGGAMLNSAMYTYRGAATETMTRRLALPTVFTEDGALIDTYEQNRTTFLSLEELIRASKTHADKLAERRGKATHREVMQMSQALGNTSLLLGIYAHDYPEVEGEQTVMRQVLSDEMAMQLEAQRIAVSTGLNPSLAQLRSVSTPLGAHIINDTLLPLETKAAFKEAVDETSYDLGY